MALLKNLCRALFIFEKIKTTLHKAREARRLAERLIEYAKRSDLTAKRYIYRLIPDHILVKIICDEIAPKFAARHGGYTRIYRIGPRLGDGAEMAILELAELSDESAINDRRKLVERRQIEKKGQVKKDKEKKEKVKKEDHKKEEPSKKDKTPKKDKQKP